MSAYCVKDRVYASTNKQTLMILRSFLELKETEPKKISR